MTRRTKRGEETRRRLIEAARTVFEESGFVGSRIEDITKTAGTANGSFYTYFTSKEDILLATAFGVYDELNEATRGDDSLDPISFIEDVNERYIDAWIRNSKMLIVLYQVAEILPEFFERLHKSHQLHAIRHAARLSRLQEEGLIDPDLDVYHTAVALGAMVERSLRWWVGLGEPYDRDIALRTLNALWIRSIGLDHRADQARPLQKEPNG